MSTILTKGKKTNKDLAEWFGISPGTFGNTKTKRLEELSKFAEYHIEKGKVIIDKVLIPIYSKQIKKNYQKIKERIDPTWSETGLDTCSRVAKEIYVQLTEEDENFKLKDTTVYNYTRQGRNELYGKPFLGGGEIGRCEYRWCKKTENGYEELTTEEKKIRNQLIRKYFGNIEEKTLLVNQMVDDGELSSQEAFGYLKDILNMKDVNYLDFINALQERIGCHIVKGTYVERSAF